MSKVTFVVYDANFTDGSDPSKMTAILTYDDNSVVRISADEFENNKKQFEERVDIRDERIAALTAEIGELRGKISKLEKVKTA